MPLFFISCVTYQHKVDEARFMMERGQPVLAAKELAPLAQPKSIDQLVYLLDYGTALQLAGEYKKSNKIFLQADQLAEAKDYISISKQAISLLWE